MSSEDKTIKLRILNNNTQLLYEQRELLNLFKSNEISALVIGDSSVALYYPNILSRELRDIDILLQKECFEDAVDLCSQNGYLSFELPEDDGYCAHFMRSGFTINLLCGLKLLSDEHKNELLNEWITYEIPMMARIGNDIIPTLQYWSNGLLQLALLRIDIKHGRIEKQSLIDWMMFVKSYLNDENWIYWKEKADQLGLKELAINITCFGKKYIDINALWCEEPSEKIDGLMVVDTRIKPSHHRTDKKTGLIDWFKHILRFFYRFIKQSPLRNVFYNLDDLSFIIAEKMQGRPHIQPEDVSAVEKDVSFVFKSFNRQRQARRLYHNIKEYYPNANVIVADDSEKPLNLPGVIHLPLNSGLSRGLQAALNVVDTPYVVRLDDDMLLTPNTNIHKELEFMKNHPEVDLVAVMADYRKPKEYALKFSRIKMNKKLIIPAGTLIGGKEVVYKTPNCFIARTEKLQLVGYDANIRINEHDEFFTRAAGKMVCVLDSDSYIMHCHNRFERQEYESFRYDTEKDNQYIRGKHASMYQREII